MEDAIVGFLKGANERYLAAVMTQKGDDQLAKINRWKWFLCMARFCLDNKVGGYRCRSQVPEHEILKIIRMYAPIITEFFENEEEMAKFQKWRDEQAQKEGAGAKKVKSA